MTKDERKMLRTLAEASTMVTSWYPHGETKEAEGPTVRGPFHRWFVCWNVSPDYQHLVANPMDDCKFAAAAMNNLVPLLDKLDTIENELEKAVKFLKEGKALFSPHTTNSFVDDFIQKHSKG